MKLILQRFKLETGCPEVSRFTRYPEEAIKIAQRILNLFNAPFLSAGKEFHVKASLGIALAPYDGEDAG